MRLQSAQSMRVAVVGATGRIGRLTVEALKRGGHETVGSANYVLDYWGDWAPP